MSRVALGGSDAVEVARQRRLRRRSRLEVSFVLFWVVAVGGCKGRGEADRCPARPGKHHYLYVSEVDVRDACFAKHEYRVAGRLVPGSHRVRQTRGQVEHRFTLAHKGWQVPVRYVGVAAALREDMKIMVEGRVKDGRFVAQQILTRPDALPPMSRR